jgi:hypothetical protein
MIERDTDLQNSTDTAINYTRCYQLPFLLISFSGGRTSAKMLHWCWNNLQDQYQMKVVFANTGKEDEGTLEFVQKCSTEWNIPITWVEATHKDKNGNWHSKKGWKVKHRIVNFETASRNGEPFEAMIAKHGLPNVRMAICTRELKSYAIKAYAKQIGFKKYKTAIGIRADEIDRINPNHEKKGFIYPLVSAGTTKSDVNKFWINSDFDLQLKGYEGNCDFCFKKSLRKLLTLTVEQPKKLEWWQKMEKKYSEYVPYTRKAQNKKTSFFRNRLTTNDLIELSKQNFEKAKDDSKYVETQLSLFELDISNGCVESCEVF